MAQEIPFEALYLALEPTRGGAVANPTHRLNMRGTLLPHQDVFRPDDALGSLAGKSRSEIVRRWSTFEGEGAMDVWTLPVLLNMALAQVTTPTTPAGATNARLWTFIRNVVSDTIKSGKVWWGDPNFQMYAGAYGMLDELTLAADATGTDGSTMGVSVTTQFQDDVATPTLPGVSLGPLIVPKKMQVFLDTTLAIGTTELVATVLSAEHTVPVGVTYKYPGTGPAGGVTYARVGRVPTSPETKITLEMLDLNQYHQFENGDRVKLRVRHNGPLIEAGFYNYVEVDAYGILDSPDWGEFEDSNRTLKLTVVHEYDTALGSDLRVAVQSTRTTL